MRYLFFRGLSRIFKANALSAARFILQGQYLAFENPLLFSCRLAGDYSRRADGVQKNQPRFNSAFHSGDGYGGRRGQRAIEGALESGRVISVLAHGFDYCYPAYNDRLVKTVEERGLLITEHTPQIAPKAYLFPVRNRIIAGLSEGTLVVSAGEKSGALITADYAVEYGRQLFVFPYNIGVASGAGCNSLIKKGGMLTENILDILSAFGLDFKEPEKQPLSEEEQRLFSLIGSSGEIFVPDAAEKLGRLPFQLIPLLTSLEVKGLIVRLGGNRYAVI